MANAVGFDGSNDLLLAPKGEDCRDLQIFRDSEKVISCWRLTDEELEVVKETGIIWFYCMGRTHPPIYISGEALVLSDDGQPSKAEPYIPVAVKGGDIQ